MRIAVTAAATIWILIIARDVLQPLAVALLVWLVLTAVTRKITGLLPPPLKRGRVVVRLAGALGTLLLIVALTLFVAGNVAELRANIPVYEANLDRWVAHVGEVIGEPDVLSIATLLGRIDLTAFAISLAGSTAAYLATLFVVISYAVFIFVEAEAVDGKIAAFARDPAGEQQLRRFLAKVRRGIDDFLAVQTLVGVVQAVPTYALLVLLDVDAPLFFAVLVFLFSYIPTIGTLIGIAFPTLMTLVQFASLVPTLIVLTVLGVIQVVASNLLAPKLMSRSLNLSPLAVLFGVFAGGAVWGVVGALIAVPVLTIAAIVCAEQPSLRRVAVVLSANGTLPDLDPAEDEEGEESGPEPGAAASPAVNRGRGGPSL